MAAVEPSAVIMSTSRFSSAKKPSDFGTAYTASSVDIEGTEDAVTKVIETFFTSPG